MTVVNFKINGCWYKADLATLPPDITLNTFIREHCQLTATKFMCLEGGCGACIITIRGKHPVTGKQRTWAANSCLTLLNSCVAWEITTCEGIGNKSQGYHPIQRRMAKLNATQCGFCTPGFVMNMYSLLESKDYKITMKEVEDSFGGNICRCTGYRPILDAMKSFAIDSTIALPMECHDIEDLPIKSCSQNGDPCSGRCKSIPKQLLYGDGSVWYWPKTIDELIDILAKISSIEEYTLVSGNTAHGVYRRSKAIKHFIDINDIADLKCHQLSKETLTLGANLSLSECMEIFREAGIQPGFEYCQQLWEHFNLIANVPVRNAGTLAGNISLKKMYKDFNSDVFTTFEALNVQLIIISPKAKREKLSLREYLDLQTPRMVITSFELPVIPKKQSIFKSYKIMPRAQNSKAIVNAAFLLYLDLETGIVSQSRLCFGSIRPDFVHATAVEGLLANRSFWDKTVMVELFSTLQETLQPLDVLPETSAEYRRVLACALMYKFLLAAAPANMVKAEYRCGAVGLQRNISSGDQKFATQKEKYPVTQPVQKIEAAIQCSGEAQYVNDILTADSAVHCAFVHATHVGGTIEEIITSEALALPGVIAFYSAKDIPGTNSFVGAEFRYDVEEIFASEKILFYDQPLGVIVADSHDIAQSAAALVKVKYSKGKDSIMPTLQDVLENKDMDRIRNIKITELVDTATCHGKGVFEMGPQYHFTMEPHTSIAVPFEQGLQVFCCTQWMDHVQAAMSKMLNINAADVHVKVRRIGGGFGCKTTGGNRVACASALAAWKLNRPVRFVQTIESMMSCVGKRWACRSDYDFHAEPNGKIVTLSNTFYEDAGCTLNENAITVVTFQASRSCYALSAENFKQNGYAVLTDAPSSLFCRAPGTLEGVAMIENIMEHIAFETGVDPAQVRLNNMERTHKMYERFTHFLTTREYKQRRLEIDSFNVKNRWLKRGIGLCLSEFRSHYLGPFTATVSIYHTDGSVVISHGGIEMGQGCNTKAAQVAALFLQVPLESIKVEASNTINGANSYFSNASVTSESVCYAVRKACNVLNERLKPIRDTLKANASWMQILQAAWKKSVNLIATEAFARGDMKSYILNGLCLTEVEVDILTGNHLIKRVDILQDCGESLNPYIDVGQVEGAFMMGIGYWLTEKLVYDRQTGQLLTNRTWTYKPPGAKDIPIDFRIELLQGSPNSEGFMRSKAVGEPPINLSVSVVFAIQHAIQSARLDAGLPKKWLNFGAPTTPETIVLNAGTDISHLKLE